jgi:hypothetical protein
MFMNLLSNTELNRNSKMACSWGSFSTGVRGGDGNSGLDESLEFEREPLDGSFALSGSVNHLGSTGNMISGVRVRGVDNNIVTRYCTFFNDLDKSVRLHYPAYFLGLW